MSLAEILVAIVPAVVIVALIYRKDKIEHEPIGLLVKLFLLGALSIIPAVILEMIGEFVEKSFLEEGTILFYLIDNFLCVALVEEWGKKTAFRIGAFKNKNFNYTFDAIVYASVIGIGFAVPENLLYVFDGGLSLALLRAVTSIPGHIAFGVYMGYFFGKAKEFDAAGNNTERDKNLKLAFWIPVVLHGFYDFSVSVQAIWGIIAFIIFAICLDVFAVRLVIKASRSDRLIDTRHRLYVNKNEFISRGIISENEEGVSYLVSDTEDNGAWVVTQMSENASGLGSENDKFIRLIDGYNILSKIGIAIPKLFEVDMVKKNYSREYINGPTLEELASTGRDQIPVYAQQLRAMAETLKGSGVTLIPDISKYAVQDGRLYYISYVTVPYSEEAEAKFERFAEDPLAPVF